MKIFDAKGSLIQTMERGVQNAGNHSVEFVASDLPSGVYYYRLETDDFTDTKQMILLK